MTEKEYLDNMYEEAFEEQRKEYNKALIDKYPWLSLNREWFWSEEESEYNGYYKNVEEDYMLTWLDMIPDGWRLAFGLDMVEELDKEIKKWSCLDQFIIMDIKEKWGTLRVDISAEPVGSNIHDILDKYVELSYDTCVMCGKKAKYFSRGYILPLCEDCKNKINKDYPQKFDLIVDK